MAKAWLKLVGTLALLALPVEAVFGQAQGPTTSRTAPPELFTNSEGGRVVHRASGYAFPDRLADMPRRKFLIYAADDVQVNYTLNGGGNGDAWVDVFVYPARRSVQDEAKGVEAELVRNFGGTPVAVQPPLPPSAKGAVGKWFEGKLKGRPMTTAYVIVKRGHWYILARGSSPVEAGSAGLERLQAAIVTIDWRWDGKDPGVAASPRTAIH
jgi:hypothetical protein